jgi:hypothetical protein
VGPGADLDITKLPRLALQNDYCYLAATLYSHSHTHAQAPPRNVTKSILAFVGMASFSSNRMKRDLLAML